MAKQSIVVMKACACVSILSFLTFVVTCRSVPLDSCGKPVIPERPVPVDASIRFAANIEPNSFIALVLDSTTKRPLYGVSVLFPLLHQSVYSDSLGIARFHDLPEGRHLLSVRRIGYEVRSDTVEITRLSGAVAVYDLARRKVECVIVGAGHT
jgi:hypothetical protein